MKDLFSGEILAGQERQNGANAGCLPVSIVIRSKNSEVRSSLFLLLIICAFYFHGTRPYLAISPRVLSPWSISCRNWKVLKPLRLPGKEISCQAELPITIINGSICYACQGK